MTCSRPAGFTRNSAGSAGRDHAGRDELQWRKEGGVSLIGQLRFAHVDSGAHQEQRRLCRGVRATLARSETRGVNEQCCSPAHPPMHLSCALRCA